MSNKRSKIVGFTQLTNKANRNAFDKTHRHLFTAQIGELLPIVCEWMNPSESVQLGYQGFTRTASLQTAAFTRLRENVQYFFVPFSSLWKYFDGNINNMIAGSAGQEISRVASGADKARSLGTGMPYYNYNGFVQVLTNWFNETWVKVLAALPSLAPKLNTRGNLDSKATTTDDIDWPYCTDYLYRYLSCSDYNSMPVHSSGVEYIRNGTYRYSSIAKLLMSLGYGNYQFFLEYDVLSALQGYCSKQASGTKISSLSLDKIRLDPDFGWSMQFNNVSLENTPNLSVFPLLAYHKIIEDHYKNREWQGYSAWTCNIDYVPPTGELDMVGSLPWTYPVNSTFNKITTFMDMEYSNLPLDYLLGVLPRAQYGDEEVVTSENFNVSYPTKTVRTGDASNPTARTQLLSADGTPIPAVQSGRNLQSSTSASFLQLEASTSTGAQGVNIHAHHTHQVVIPSSTLVGNADFKISALRSALAIQKYKEIQNSNDSDFASQVLAHFGVKPNQTNTINSRFITGSDATITINPQVNQNLTGDNETEIKAIATSQLSCNGSFTADTYGLLIGIYRCVPTLDYAKVGIDRNLYKTDATDFPLPELDSIGMQTQYRTELYSPCPNFRLSDVSANMFTSQVGSLPLYVDMANTYGYLPRYSELKTSYDRFEGAFLSSLKSWVTGLDLDKCRNWFYLADSSGNFEQIEKLFRVDPHLCDSIFLNQNALTVDDDKLLIGSVNTLKFVRSFSVYGLPWSN